MNVASARVILVVAQCPVDQHAWMAESEAMTAAVLGGDRFDDFDVARPAVPDQRADRTAFGGRSAELVVDDERAQAKCA